MNTMMTPAGEARWLGLVAWGGAGLRRRLWRQRNFFRMRDAAGQAVRWVLRQ